MLKIGITGGIGSGKSIVSRLFQEKGIPVYNADYEAKKLMDTDKIIHQQITEVFGEESYQNNTLNRKHIADIAFNNPEKLKALNDITHPRILQHAKQWMESQNAPFTLKEAALIFESGSAADLDYVIGVYAPKVIRMKRVMDRDGVSRDEVLRRMQNQINEEIKMRLCDFIIVNDDQQLVIPQVDALNEKLIELAKQKKV